MHVSERRRWVLTIVICGFVSTPVWAQTNTLGSRTLAMEKLLLESQRRMPIVYYTGAFLRLGVIRGVTVWRHRDTKIVRLGAEALLPVSPRRVLKALLAYDLQTKIFKRVQISKVLARGKNWVKIYQRLHLPVIWDRDFVLKVKWGKRGTRRWVSYWALKNASPQPLRQVIRVTHHLGSWELIPKHGGTQTLARYQFSIDMAGELPPWMAKQNAWKELPETFEAICQLTRPAKSLKNCIAKPDNS